jgi:hypothetical protein
MGIVNAESVNKVVAGYAFDAGNELNKVSGILKDTTVSTTGGYWLVNVVEINPDMALDDDNRSILKSQLMSDWLDGLWTNSSYVVENYLNPINKKFAQEQLDKITRKKAGT